MSLNNYPLLFLIKVYKENTITMISQNITEFIKKLSLNNEHKQHNEISNTVNGELESLFYPISQ